MKHKKRHFVEKYDSIASKNVLRTEFPLKIITFRVNNNYNFLQYNVYRFLSLHMCIVY